MSMTWLISHTRRVLTRWRSAAGQRRMPALASLRGYKVLLNLEERVDRAVTGEVP